MSNIPNNQEDRSSRRSFFATIGQFVAGLAVAIVGGSVSTRQALAETLVSQHPANVPLECCFGGACYQYGCPPKSAVAWTWLCDQGDNGTYQCNDCYEGSRLICVYPTVYSKRR